MDRDSNDDLAALFASYAHELPAIILEIVEIWRALEIQWDDKLYADFHRKIHNLAGSAEMYGYDNVSQIANQIQLTIRSGMQENKLIQNDITQIDSLIKQLELCLMKY